MLRCPDGQTVHVEMRRTGNREPLEPDDARLKTLAELGYAGPAPRTAAEAEELLHQEEFRRAPPTTQQRRLIELICLYGGDCPPEEALRSRWEAGCWIKAHIAAAGDWPFFDG